LTLATIRYWSLGLIALAIGFVVAISLKETAPSRETSQPAIATQ
jgi:hypothetical protein